MDEPLPDAELEAPERTTYRATIGGAPVGTGSIVLRPDGEKHVVQEIEGEAFDRLGGTVTVRFRRRGGVLLAESQVIDVRDGDRPVLVEEANFRDVQVPQIGGEVSPYPRAMVPAAGLPTALRLVELGAKTRLAPRLWLAAVLHWPVDVRVEAKEKVETPAGKIEAWRIRLRPSLVDVSSTLDELSASVLPPIVAHVAVDGQRFLRLAFPTGPSRQDPPGVIEATEIG